MGHDDEIKILHGIKEGDEKILKDFYKKNLKIIRKLILDNSGTENDMEDVFQDALIILYQKLKSDTFSINCSIHTYFYSVCKNIWRNRLRKKHKISCCGAVDNILLEIEDSISNIVEEKEREHVYRKHFFKLNCKCQQVLTLFLEGKSMREIAVITESTDGAARKKKFDCKKQLLQMIENDPLYRELTFKPLKAKAKSVI